MMKRIIIVVLIPLFFICFSCGPKTRTITPLSESDKSNIKKVAINIQVDEKLDANISTIKQRYWASALAGFDGSCDYGSCLLLIPILLAWIVTEETVRSHMDQGRENELNEDLSDLDMENIMAERIDEYFENTAAPYEADITGTQSPHILVEQGFDTILDISVEKLKLLLCPKRYVSGYIEEDQGGAGPLSSDDADYSPAISRWNILYSQYVVKGPTAANEFLFSSSTKLTEEEASLVKEAETLKPVILRYANNSVRAWITYKGKLISTKDGRVLWEREEVYYDPKCENVEEMQSDPELVLIMLTRAIGDIAVNVVNEIQ